MLNICLCLCFPLIYNSWKAGVFHGGRFSMLAAVILRTSFMEREASWMQDIFKVCNFIVGRKIWCSM